MTNVLVDETAERALVGAVVYREEFWQQVGHIRPEDFGTESMRWAWEACRRLKSRSMGVDGVTLAEELQAMGRLEALHPALDASNNVPVSTHPTQYAATVRELSIKRQVQARAQALVHEAHAPLVSASELLAKAQGVFQGLSAGEVDESGDVDLYEILDAWDAWHQAPPSEALSFLPHCLGAIKEEISPGYPMSLTAVGGKEGVGKTTFLASEIRGWLFRLGIKGGVIGLEDGTSWQLKRMMADLLHIPFGKVGACRLNEHQQAALSEAAATWQPRLRAKLKRWPVGCMTSSELLAKVKQWKEWGARWVVIDHGLRVRYEGERGRGRYDMAIDETLTELAELARPRREHPGMAVIMAWHLNRDVPDGVMPTKDHFKEGGYVGANARYMPAVWKDPARPGHRLVTCTKANLGPPDWTVAIPLNEQAGLLSASEGYKVDFQAEREAAAEKAREEKDSKRAHVKLFGGGKS